MLKTVCGSRDQIVVDVDDAARDLFEADVLHVSLWRAEALRVERRWSSEHGRDEGRQRERRSKGCESAVGPQHASRRRQSRHMRFS